MNAKNAFLLMLFIPIIIEERNIFSMFLFLVQVLAGAILGCVVAFLMKNST